MRISDWSSDVCSSDLLAADIYVRGAEAIAEQPRRGRACRDFQRIHGLFETAVADHPGALGRRQQAQGLGRYRGLDRAGGEEQPAVPGAAQRVVGRGRARSEEQPSELQSLMRSSYAVFCL